MYVLIGKLTIALSTIDSLIFKKQIKDVVSEGSATAEGTDVEV